MIDRKIELIKFYCLNAKHYKKLSRIFHRPVTHAYTATHICPIELLQSRSFPNLYLRRGILFHSRSLAIVLYIHLSHVLIFFLVKMKQKPISSCPVFGGDMKSSDSPWHHFFNGNSHTKSSQGYSFWSPKLANVYICYRQSVLHMLIFAHSALWRKFS